MLRIDEGFYTAIVNRREHMNCENCKYYHKLLLNSHERKHCCTILLQYPTIDEVCEVKPDDTCDKYEEKEQK